MILDINNISTSQSTGGEQGGEMRNCLSGVGGCSNPSSLSFLTI